MIKDRQCAQAEDGNGHAALECLGDRLRAEGHLHHAEGGEDGIGRAFVPLTRLGRLQRQGLDGAHAVNGFDHHRLPLGLGCIEPVQARLEGLDKGHHHQRHGQGKQEHHAGEHW